MGRQCVKKNILQPSSDRNASHAIVREKNIYVNIDSYAPNMSMANRKGYKVIAGKENF